MYPSSNDINLYMAELAGESRDHAMRPVLEYRILNFVTNINEEWEHVEHYLADNVTMIITLDRPGHIFKGRKTVFEKLSQEIGKNLCRVVVPKLIFADRGRVNCETASYQYDEDEQNIKITYRIILFDVDGARQIKRVEFLKSHREKEILDKDYKDLEPIAYKAAREFGENSSNHLLKF